MRNPETSAWTAILICAYPVIETLASMRRKARRDGHSVGQPDRVHFHMLAYRRYARRIVPAPGPVHLRNPATSVVTWPLPLLTAVFAAIAYESVLGERLLLLRDRLHLRPALPGDVAQRAEPAARTRAPALTARARCARARLRSIDSQFAG